MSSVFRQASFPKYPLPFLYFQGSWRLSQERGIHRIEGPGEPMDWKTKGMPGWWRKGIPGWELCINLEAQHSRLITAEVSARPFFRRLRWRWCKWAWQHWEGLLTTDGKSGDKLVGGGLAAKLCLTLGTLWTVAHRAPLPMGFSRQEYWSGLPFPSPGDLPDPGVRPGSLAL